MKLIWSYSRNMKFHASNEFAMMNLYKASMIRAKELGHQVNFYGDRDSIKSLKPFIDGDICDVTSKGFSYLDDLKVFIHTLEGLEACTIDGDIILEEKAQNIKADVWVDFPENRKDLPNTSFTEGYYDIVKKFDKYNVKSFIPGWRLDLKITPNVGFLKFNSKKIKNLYIESYYDLRNFFMNEIKKNEDLGKYCPTLFLGQYMWGCLNEAYKVDIEYAENQFKYKHFWGTLKDTELCRKTVSEIIGKSII